MTAKELYKRALVAVTAVRAAWTVLMLSCTLLALMFLPWWTLLVIPIIAVFTYHAMIALVGIYFASIAELDQLKECREMLKDAEQQEQQQEVEEENPLSIGDVVSLGEHIGTLGDRKIYDWIIVQLSETTCKFVFDRGAPIENNEYVDLGSIQVDEACYQGIIYKKSTM
jgi:hypothetical protein